LRRQYSFGDFTLDVERRVLLRRGEEIALGARSFDVLACLLDHHGQLVTKSALIEAVWGDTAVTDNSVAQCVVEIRRALSDNSQNLIRTVSRRGYQFAATLCIPVVEFPSQAPATLAEPGRIPPSIRAPGQTLRRYFVAGCTLVLALAIGSAALFRLTRPARYDLAYTQITNFTDSAVAPALSPDGRMVAFYRSGSWFHTPDQIYLKFLPDGEPVQLTNDPRLKYGVAFSADSSRIAYTVEDLRGFKTFTVSALGGQPSLLLANAAGLTWLDQRQVLFSEQDGRGAHMGIVTATENRSGYRRLYFPEHERAMAHFSYASPDRKWALVVEMDPVWQPCRLIPLDGSRAGRQVGPVGQCTSAAWSPDGKWMYFGAKVEGRHHLWRQRFPAGRPEQITSGPTEEDGLAVAWDGHSLITSIGLEESAIWIHDDLGDRPLSSEGRVASLRLLSLVTNYRAHPSARFSSDGKFLFHLLRHDSPASPSELWRLNLESGRNEPFLRGISMVDYDISNDGKEVVFSTQPPGKAAQLWLARLDRSSAPRLIASTGESAPSFGPDGKVVFQFTDGKANYIGRIASDGSNRSKVVPEAIADLYTRSPDRRWILAGNAAATVAVPTGGGSSRRICSWNCPAAWAPDGKFLYVGLTPSSQTTRGKTLAIPIPPREDLPNLPASGIRGLEDAKVFPGARVLDAWDISPGPSPFVYAYVKTTIHRNLYRIPVP
jgi:DNA-binding winged helix-turn-helix (wHTH) protein/Tol biopolymer transport system component